MNLNAIMILRSRFAVALYFGVILFASCQSKVATQDTTTASPRMAAAASSIAPPRQGLGKFSFYVSGSGLGAKPFDSFRMDTNGVMTVIVTRRKPDGTFRTLHAMAELEAPDYDTLHRMIEHGKLAVIDSTDLTQVCAESELYRVIIVPLDGRSHTSVTFSGCASDYNLLLEPQRRYFKLFMEWWERMRVKYRPAESE